MQADAVVALEQQLGQLPDPKVRKMQVGPDFGPTSAFPSCIITGMHGSTCIVWANLTPFSLKEGKAVLKVFLKEQGGMKIEEWKRPPTIISLPEQLVLPDMVRLSRWPVSIEF
jgi:hypothetical protein